MEVILIEDMPKLGKVGEIVKVKPGYARNYLLPQKKGLLANSENVKALEAQRKMIEAKQAKLKKNAEEIAKKIENLEITIEKEVGSQDRLFGSVTKLDIVAALQKAGISVDKHIIELDEPIKSLGTYDVILKLHSGVDASFKLWVVRQSEK